MASNTDPPYFSLLDAIALLGPATMIAIFDDDNDQEVDTDPFNRLANLACTRVDGFLKRVYPGPYPLAPNLLSMPPGQVPEDVQQAALMWFRALAYERHLEYVRQYGKEPRKEAMQMCEDLTDAKEWLADLPGGAPPGNAGGIVVDHGPRMMVTSANGERNEGDF